MFKGLLHSVQPSCCLLRVLLSLALLQAQKNAEMFLKRHKKKHFNHHANMELIFLSNNLHTEEQYRHCSAKMNSQIVQKSNFCVFQLACGTLFKYVLVRGVTYL